MQEEMLLIQQHGTIGAGDNILSASLDKWDPGQMNSWSEADIWSDQNHRARTKQERNALQMYLHRHLQGKSTTRQKGNDKCKCAKPCIFSKCTT